MIKVIPALLLLLLSACTFVERQVECYYESGYEYPHKVDTVK